MTISTIFINDAGRLRSGWRLLVFVLLFVLFLTLLAVFAQLAQAVLPVSVVAQLRVVFNGGWGFIIERGTLFVVAALAGYICGRVLEGLPWRALGWGLHEGWLRDLTFGVAVGAASLVLAAGLCAAVGGLRFEFTSNVFYAVARTLLASGIIFIVGAAFEEIMFRGYPLQTLLRSLPFPVAIIPSSIYFGYIHLNNPNVSHGWTFVNTILAGVWLAIAYWRTRSLWFPFGVHFAWNWTQGALLGIPVSGITSITPAPLFRSLDAGPTWLTGGAYGIEGGAACTLALVVSSALIWRTKFLRATDELKFFTSAEHETQSGGRDMSHGVAVESSPQRQPWVKSKL